MPIEIKELNIRINVSGNQPEQGDKPATQTGEGSGGAANKEELIAECVEQVMELIRNKRDR